MSSVRPLLRSLFSGVCAALMFATNAAHAAEIQTVGQASGEDPSARANALADALRQAVERGAGVNLLSKTTTKDFTLSSDEVIAQSFGYVRSYTVIDQTLGNDGVYRVTIRAEVQPGEPDRADTMALQHIVRQKGSPRIAFVVKENIEGVPADQQPIRDWIEQAGRKMQLNVVAVEVLREHEAAIVARDQRVDPSTISPVLKRLANESDYVIEVTVDVRKLGGSSFNNSLPHERFAVTGVLRGFQPDTGRLLSTVPLDGGENVRIYTRDAVAGAREAALQVLEGRVVSGARGAWPLFRQIMAQWAVEIDLGALVRLELPVMERAQHDSIVSRLNDTREIGGVWVRSYDVATGTTLDLESRLPAFDIARIVEGAGPVLKPDLVTAHFVRMSGPSSDEDRSFVVTDLIHASPDRRLWLIIGAAVVLGGGGLLLILALRR